MDLKKLFVLAFVILCTFGEEEGNDIAVGGVTGKIVVLTCDLPMSSPPMVKWLDYVYNTNANPSIIFNSEHNEAFVVNQDHENNKNFFIERDFSLTISNLNVEKDPGNYICQSQVDDIVYKKSYYLTVGSKPHCTGKVDLEEGSKTLLECELEYSGTQPTIEWLRGSEKVISEDNFDLRLAKRSLSLTATYKDDKTKYTCHMTIGNIVEECSFTLNVTHLVRDLEISPERETLEVGEELTCRASGNPTPTISLLPLSSKGNSGDGWRSIVIEPEWKDKQITVNCLANNALNGKIEVIEKNMTINVIEKQKIEEPISVSGLDFTSAVIIGIVIAVVILGCLVVVAIIVMIKRRGSMRPKGSKPLHSKEDISQGRYSNGQSV